jgi:hypothetical protein
MSASLQLPIPVSGSGVMLDPRTVNVFSSQICEPPENRLLMSNTPPGRGVWQPSQPMTALTR